MYKKNSLNLFLNTESDNMSSDFNLLKKLQKDIEQNKNTDVSPTSTDIMSINNKINNSTTSDDDSKHFIKQQKKTSLSNVLKPYINTKSYSVTSSDNFNLNNNILSTTSDDDSKHFIKQQKKPYSVTSSDNFNLNNNILSTTSDFIDNKKKNDYLINETSEYFNNETSEYMSPQIDLNYIHKQNNNSIKTEKVSSNTEQKSGSNERTVNLTNIFNDIVGIFTYLFTLDDKSDDDDSDII
jgi:hypothetical protein